MFADSFFNEGIRKKYDSFLFHKNYPFKTFEGYFYETIQQVEIPGLNLKTISVAGLNNFGNSSELDGQVTVNREYPGTSPINEIVTETVVNLTFRNTIINYLYCYEVLYGYYKRKRSLTDFLITLTMLDSAENPMIRFKLSDCFVSAIPGLTFAYNQSFNESKTFDIGFSFNKFDVEFIIPDFDLTKMTL